MAGEKHWNKVSSPRQRIHQTDRRGGRPQARLPAGNAQVDLCHTPLTGPEFSAKRLSDTMRGRPDRNVFDEVRARRLAGQ